jgi:hypothetical protein
VGDDAGTDLAVLRLSQELDVVVTPRESLPHSEGDPDSGTRTGDGNIAIMTSRLTRMICAKMGACRRRCR